MVISFSMKVLYKDELIEIKNIIEKYSKYQKVMLLYDNTVSNSLLYDIYQTIREDCIFNKINIGNGDMSEVYNGYRVIIFVGDTTTFLAMNIRWEEFINIFIPLDEGILPYFLESRNESGFLLLKKYNIDVSIISSLEFNNIYRIICDLYNNNEISDFQIESKPYFSLENTINILDEIPFDMFFIDLDIIKKSNIQYRYLSLINLLLINGILLLMTSVKRKECELVDAYKLYNSSPEIIDRLYSRFGNGVLVDILSINYKFLLPRVEDVKDKILKTVQLFGYSREEILEVLDKLKEYCKYDEGILGDLYLYNIFDV